MLTSHALVIHMIVLGLGKHFDSVLQSSEIDQMKALYAAAIVYNISITLPKVSVLLFYARVFTTQSKPFKYALWCSHFLVASWLISITSVTVFGCNPIKKIWLLTTPGHCHPNSVLWLVNAISSVVIDLILLLLPLPTLWHLQMKSSRKILIMAVFICGYWWVSLETLYSGC